MIKLNLVSHDKLQSVRNTYMVLMFIHVIAKLSQAVKTQLPDQKNSFEFYNGYTTLRRITLRLLSHFVEKAFCRSAILSNVHFVETGFRRILSTKYSMLTWPHIVSADHVIVRRADCHFYKGARE